MNKFKVGDKVYCIEWSKNICVLKEYDDGIRVIDTVNGSYLIDAYDCDLEFCDDSKTMEFVGTNGVCPLIHATPKNHALLEQLYGIGFEKPPAKPTSREVIKALLKKQKYVLCYVSDDCPNPTDPVSADIIYKVENDYYFGTGDYAYEYATPVDITTGEIITEIPDV